VVVTVIALELLFVLLIVCLLCRAPYGVLANQPLGGGRRSDWREAQERAEQMLRDVLAELSTASCAAGATLKCRAAPGRAGCTASRVTRARSKCMRAASRSWHYVSSRLTRSLTAMWC